MKLDSLEFVITHYKICQQSRMAQYKHGDASKTRLLLINGKHICNTTCFEAIRKKWSHCDMHGSHACLVVVYTCGGLPTLYPQTCAAAC